MNQIPCMQFKKWIQIVHFYSNQKLLRLERIFSFDCFFSGCGHHFHNIHHHVHSRVNPQYITVLHAKSRFSRSRKRLSSICSSRGHLHVLVYIWIPGKFFEAHFFSSKLTKNWINLSSKQPQSESPHAGLKPNFWCI